MFMNAEDFEKYCKRPEPGEEIEYVTVDEVAGPDRTLAYGYTCERETWHAYLFQDQIHVVVYSGVPRGTRPVALRHHECGEKLPVGQMRPDKRVYPASVDRNFAYLMVAKDEPLPVLLGPWDTERYERVKDLVFHGIRFDEFDPNGLIFPS